MDFGVFSYILYKFKRKYSNQILKNTLKTLVILTFIC